MKPSPIPGRRRGCAPLLHQRGHGEWERFVRHPGGNPEGDPKSISHRCHPILVAFVWELTKETIHLPLGCLQGGQDQCGTILCCLLGGCSCARHTHRTRSSSERWCRTLQEPSRKVDVRLPGKGDSISHGARPVHLIITMIKWIRTSKLSIKNPLSAGTLVAAAATGDDSWRGARGLRSGATRHVRHLELC